MGEPDDVACRELAAGAARLRERTRRCSRWKEHAADGRARDRTRRRAADLWMRAAGCGRRPAQLIIGKWLVRHAGGRQPFDDDQRWDGSGGGVQAGELVGGERQVGGGGGVVDRRRPGGARDRDDDVGLREVPGERHLVHRDAELLGHLRERRAPSRPATRPSAPRRTGSTGCHASPSSAQCASSSADGAPARRELVLHADQGVADDRPGRRRSGRCRRSRCRPSAPGRRRPARAAPPIDSSHGVAGSGRWNW